MFVGAAEQRRDEYDRDMRVAWHVAYLSSLKKLPTLRSLQARASHGSRGPARGSRGQSAQHRAAVTMLSEQYGIPLRRASPETLAALRH